MSQCIVKDDNINNDSNDEESSKSDESSISSGTPSSFFATIKYAANDTGLEDPNSDVSKLLYKKPSFSVNVLSKLSVSSHKTKDSQLTDNIPRQDSSKLAFNNALDVLMRLSVKNDININPSISELEKYELKHVEAEIVNKPNIVYKSDQIYKPDIPSYKEDIFPFCKNSKNQTRKSNLTDPSFSSDQLKTSFSLDYSTSSTDTDNSYEHLELNEHEQERINIYFNSFKSINTRKLEIETFKKTKIISLTTSELEMLIMLRLEEFEESVNDNLESVNTPFSASYFHFSPGNYRNMNKVKMLHNHELEYTGLCNNENDADYSTIEFPDQIRFTSLIPIYEVVYHYILNDFSYELQDTFNISYSFLRSIFLFKIKQKKKTGKSLKIYSPINTLIKKSKYSCIIYQLIQRKSFFIHFNKYFKRNRGNSETRIHKRN